MDTRASGQGSVIATGTTPIPAVPCSVARGHRGNRAPAGQRNPLQVFGRGGPRVGPKYEALRVQQWIAWITGQRDWVTLATVARALGTTSDKLRGVLRRHDIPRRYDARGRTMISLSQLPRILDIMLSHSSPTVSHRPTRG